MFRSLPLWYSTSTLLGRGEEWKEGRCWTAVGSEIAEERELEWWSDAVARKKRGRGRLWLNVWRWVVAVCDCRCAGDGMTMGVARQKRGRMERERRARKEGMAVDKSSDVLDACMDSVERCLREIGVRKGCKESEMSVKERKARLALGIRMR